MPLVDLNERQGTLAWPLDWMMTDLLAPMSSKPALAMKLLTAERPRLHFLAFVLSMDTRAPAIELVDQALTLPMRDVLAKMELSELRGLRRLLGRIPGRVMQREDYQLLARLLSEPSAASVLYHATEVSGALLQNIQRLPPLLRTPIIVAAIAHIADAADHVVQWIEIAAARAQAPPTSIQLALGGCSSHMQLRTELDKLLDGLSALAAAPPDQIGDAVRVDAPSAIRRLGKRFKNCLCSFVDAEVDGTTHIYHWKSEAAEALCEVCRVGNLGWFLGSHLGPANSALPEDVAGRIHDAFKKANIHLLRIIEVYDDLYFATGGRDAAFASGNSRAQRPQRGRYHPD